jgi:plastocyanin
MGRHTPRSLLILTVLCMTFAASLVAVALAAPTRHTPHPSSTAKRACHHKKHRRCPVTRADKHAKRKRKDSSPSTQSQPGGDPAGSGTTTPAVSAPSSTSTAGAGTTLANPVSEVPPVSTPPVEAPPVEESPSAPGAPAHLEVTAEDTNGYRFVLSRPSVPAGKVILEFVNHGQDEHNLNAVGPTEESESSLAGSIPNTVPNAHPSLTLTLRPGSYTLFCSMPGHEAKGMKATLLVK